MTPFKGGKRDMDEMSAVERVLKLLTPDPPTGQEPTPKDAGERKSKSHNGTLKQRYRYEQICAAPPAAD